MPYQVDIPINLNPRLNKTYRPSSLHRGKRFTKSRWLISITKEVDGFITSQISNWVEVSVSWIAIRNGNSLVVLGVNKNNNYLKIGKFVDGNNNDIWHGYPADYVNNSQDRPGINILINWRTKGLIEKHHINKIRKGKECNL